VSPNETRRLAVRSGRFAIVGDLQRTSRAELWRESNLPETRLILRQTAAEAPDFVVLLGDLIFRGSSRREWSRFDEVTEPLREAGVPIFPILGNHEYWLTPRPALANYFRRFPDLGSRHWYSLTYGSLRLVLLDSNRRFLPARRWNEQVGWYETEMSRLDADPATRGAVVFVHHPPYTNSTVTSDEDHVQRAFVPAFQRARKSLAMISGHVHSYERFERAGKIYLVAGGGGGPRARLAVGRRVRHADDLFAGPSLRHFHFLLASLSPLGLEIVTRGLEKRATEFQPMDRFLLRFPQPGILAGA
jgi:3',5'-cyclic AMP phosphodiesterase CpdA